MYTVNVIYDDDKFIENFNKFLIDSDNVFYSFIDERTRTGKKKGWQIKASLGARLCPFIAVYKEDIPIKAFYTEADNDIINSLNCFLNECN
jgi:hypothetical protein